MRIDAYATERHYLNTIAPVWHALDPEVRGVVYLAGNPADTGESEGMGPVRFGHPPGRGALTMVAGYKDEVVVSTLGCVPIYLEHGAGQTYNGRADTAAADDPSFSGSARHDKVVLFVCPNETVAARWRARYPEADAVAVGIPRLDRFHEHPRVRRSRPKKPVVAVTFHSAVPFCLESMWAFPDFEPALRSVSLAYPGAIGHGHPRVWPRLEPVWREKGFERVRDFYEVLRRADVLVGDNTSALPEAASCGIPLVFMNSPHYDRSVDHGGRFWEWPQGQVSCDDPGDLVAAIDRALDDPPEVRKARQAMVAKVYLRCDGHAAERATQAIVAMAARRWPEESALRA